MTLDMKIYKYISSDKQARIKEILSDGLFHFSGWRHLNDPMEGYFRYYDADHTPVELQRIVNEKDTKGVCCFSLTHDEILLWTHYANNHKGICFEIDADIERSPDVTLEVIKYRTNIPWLKQDNNRLLSATEILSTKIAKWKYEQEIRAFCTGKNQRLKVGSISRVIFGIRVDAHIKTLVETHPRAPQTVQASLDFDTNRICV